MLDCNECKLLINMFIDGELSENEEYELKQHFKICKECEEEFNYINDIVKNLNETSEIELPEDFHENLMNNIKNINKVRKINWKFYSAVAAAFIILFVALDFYNVNKYISPEKFQNEKSIEIESENKLLKEDTNDSSESSYNIAKHSNIESYAADTNTLPRTARASAMPESDSSIYNNMILKRYDIYLEVENYNDNLKEITEIFNEKAFEIKNNTESISGRIYKDDYNELIAQLEKFGIIIKNDITEEDKNEVYNENKTEIDILFNEIENLNNKNNNEYNKTEESDIDEEINKIYEKIEKYKSENDDIEFNANNPIVNINFIKK